MKRKKTTEPGAPTGHDPAKAVEAWRQLNKATDDLHGVDTTTLHADPAANPRTLDQRIAAADTVSRAVLAEQAETADDKLAAARRQRRSRAQRGERALSMAETRADRAAATLEAIDAYEEADNPAASSLALHEADPRIRRMLIAVSLAGSAASALGIGAWARTEWDLPVAVGVGVLAEALLTVPVILLLTFQGLVRTHNKANLAALGSDARRVLAIMLGAIGVLLVVSVGLNTAGIVAGKTGLLGAVGIVGAVIALGASAASWGTTAVIRSVIKANTAQWRTQTWSDERSRLEATASGAFIPDIEAGAAAPAPAPEPGRVEADPVDAEAVEVERIRRVLAVLAEERITAMATRGTDALAVMLNPPAPATGATGADQQVPQPATPAATVPHAPVADPVAHPAQEEEEEVLEGRTWPRPATPEQGRRQLIDYAQWQIGRGQEPGIRDAARRMNTSARSITRYKEALAEDAAYAELMAAFRQQA
ncbi:hypothetical protein ACFWTE_11425 [Nocardiopsis sp. NPDC058631]|uniref:hypothetical protein n=1 Tax=Nocardiopsis sp. NPDC058631 TaxID=3346566 RepID=UPI003668BEE9